MSVFCEPYDVGDKVVFYIGDMIPRLGTIAKRTLFVEDWYTDDDVYTYDVTDDNGHSYHIGLGDSIFSANMYEDCLQTHLGIHKRKLELLREQLNNEETAIKEINKALNKIGNNCLKEIVW